MKLSILIPTVPQRVAMFTQLHAHIMHQVDMANAFGLVEVISDNAAVGSKTTGQKRNDLLLAAQGKYVWFIDDDDWISDTAIYDILEGVESEPDAFAINGTWSENGNRLTQWFISKDNDYIASTLNGKEVFLRPPNHITPMKAEHAKAIGFPNKSNQEDYDFCMRLKESGRIKTEYKIEKPIYDYRYINYNKLYV